MVKYCSSPLYTLSEQQPKAFDDKVCTGYVSVLKFSYIQRGERYKICSVPGIFKTNCKLFVSAKGKHKTKRDPADPRTLQNKAAETIL